MFNNDIFKGVSFSLLMRWSVKFIGIINTVILARLLVPTDFGLIAMAGIFSGLIEEMASVNIAFLLIRKKDLTDKDSDVAWTVSIIQGVFVGLLLIGLAPLAVDYFEEERIRIIIYYIAAGKIISGFRNIGIIIARKDLDFSLDYKFTVYARVAIFVFTMPIAFYLKDYRAIMYGGLVGEVFALLLSYAMHPYRPWLSFENVTEYLFFSFRMIPYSIGKLLSNKFDTLFIGRVSDASLLGGYNVCSELSSIFTKEIIIPTLRGLYPNLTRLDDRREFNRILLETFRFTAFMCFPITIIMCFFSKEIVMILLGEKWVANHYFLGYLAICSTASCVLTVMSEHMLIAIGKEIISNRLIWFRFIMLALSIWAGYYTYGLTGMLQSMVIVSLVTMSIILLHLSNVLRIKAFLFIKAAFPFFLASLVMIGSIYLGFYLCRDFPNPFYLNSIFVGFLGVVFYLCSVLLIWLIRGKPNGIEAVVLRF